MYKVREYDAKAESSFLKSEYENYNEAVRAAAQYGDNGEVWNETDEECLLCNRKN